MQNLQIAKQWGSVERVPSLLRNKTFLKLYGWIEDCLTRDHHVFSIFPALLPSFLHPFFHPVSSIFSSILCPMFHSISSFLPPIYFLLKLDLLYFSIAMQSQIMLCYHIRIRGFFFFLFNFVMSRIWRKFQTKQQNQSNLHQKRKIAQNCSKTTHQHNRAHQNCIMMTFSPKDNCFPNFVGLKKKNDIAYQHT